MDESIDGWMIMNKKDPCNLWFTLYYLPGMVVFGTVVEVEAKMRPGQYYLYLCPQIKPLNRNNIKYYYNWFCYSALTNWLLIKGLHVS